MRHILLLEALVQQITCDDKLPGSVINCPVPTWHISFFIAAKKQVTSANISKQHASSKDAVGKARFVQVGTAQADCSEQNKWLSHNAGVKVTTCMQPGH